MLHFLFAIKNKRIYFRLQNFCSVELDNIIIKEEAGYFVKCENGDHPEARKIIKKRRVQRSSCARCAEKESKIADLLCELERLRSKEQCLFSANEELRAKYEQLNAEHDAAKTQCNNAISELMELRSEQKANQPECSRPISDSPKTKVGPTKENKRSHEDCAEFEIEAILDRKKSKGKWVYKVHWEGYSIEESTWEPRTNLNHISIFKDYLKHHNLK